MLDICTNNVSLGIVNGQISISHHSYGPCECTKNGLWPLVPLLSGYHDETSQK